MDYRLAVDAHTSPLHVFLMQKMDIVPLAALVSLAFKETCDITFAGNLIYQAT